MRPLKLRMKGFGVFREDTEVDFTGVELAALVGPTGSGKSTIIDGVTFALFGSVARYDDARAVAPVISQLAPEATVSLDFEVGDETYTAVRVVRRTPNGATTKEARLEKGETILAGRAREMAPAVELLLGLDFDRFTKTVVLPQGRFAQFLHDQAGDRQELLRHLLDLGIYTRMGSEARSEKVRAGARLEELGSQMEAAVPSEDDVAELEARADAARTAQAELEGLLDGLAEVVEEVDAARTEAKRVAPLLQAVTAVSVPDAVQGLADRLAAAADVAEQADETHDCMRAAEQQARRDVEEGPDLRGCLALLDDRERLARLEGEFGRLQRNDQEAAAEEAGARERHVEAEAGAASAYEARDRVRSVKRAETLVAQLREGEPCPVCRQTVTNVPDHDLDAELAEVDNAHRAATKARDAAAAELQRVSREAATASAMAEASVKQRQELADRLSGQPDTEALQNAIGEAEKLETARREAVEASATAESERDDARRMLAAFKAEEAEARQEYGRGRDGVAQLRPPEPGGSLLDDWTGLAAWAEQQTVSLRAAEKAAAARMGAAENRRRDLAKQAREVCVPHFEAGDDPSRFGQDMAVAVHRTQGGYEKAVEDREKRAELEKRIKVLREEKRVSSELGWLLRADGFERWLLEEAVADLVERANEHLTVLSGGQYSFVADETSFNICDHHNADEVRGAKTLSGGETFLASLALALALRDSQAELAAEGSARLDSLFLDEGFGTLDPDTLDVVAGAIEELGASGRMVCIVTHIRELAERMPLRFEVSKGPTTSSVERVEV